MRKTYYHMTCRSSGVTGEAAERGIKLHQICEEYIKTGKITIMDSELLWTFGRVKPYLDKLIPQITETETRRIRELEDGSFKAVGVLDALLNNNVAYDWKFPTKPWGADKFLSYRATQGLLYLWIWPELDQINFAVFTDTQDFPQEFEIKRDDEEVAQALRTWKVQYQTIKTAFQFDSFEASPSKFRCRFCNFKSICGEAYEE